MKRVSVTKLCSQLKIWKDPFWCRGLYLLSYRILQHHSWIQFLEAPPDTTALPRMQRLMHRSLVSTARRLFSCICFPTFTLFFIKFLKCNKLPLLTFAPRCYLKYTTSSISRILLQCKLGMTGVPCDAVAMWDWAEGCMPQQKSSSKEKEGSGTEARPILSHTPCKSFHTCFLHTPYSFHSTQLPFSTQLSHTLLIV